MVKFGVRVRTWDILSALNFAKIAQGVLSLGENFLPKNSKFSRFLAILANISIPIMLKFYLRERRLRNLSTTQNFVRIAQRACRYCIAPWRWCIL